MKCIHGISIRKPCAKCEQESKDAEKYKETVWNVVK